ncbi:hypothetical protein ACFS07_27415 [Undibacterium arcticum]
MSKVQDSQLPLIPVATPPVWLGVMGGGQLGRMFVHAAQALGYKVAVLEPEKELPGGACGGSPYRGRLQ